MTHSYVRHEISNTRCDKYESIRLQDQKGPPFPIDLSKESSDIHLFVKSLRLACEKPKEERAQEHEYVAAAKRFKAAVRALEGNL